MNGKHFKTEMKIEVHRVPSSRKDPNFTEVAKMPHFWKMILVIKYSDFWAHGRWKGIFFGVYKRYAKLPLSLLQSFQHNRLTDVGHVCQKTLFTVPCVRCGKKIRWKRRRKLCKLLFIQYTKTWRKRPPASKDCFSVHRQSSLHRKCTANSDHLST